LKSDPLKLIVSIGRGDMAKAPRKGTRPFHCTVGKIIIVKQENLSKMRGHIWVAGAFTG